jgi:hypothetical protein
VQFEAIERELRSLGEGDGICKSPTKFRSIAKPTSLDCYLSSARITITLGLSAASDPTAKVDKQRSANRAKRGLSMVATVFGYFDG